MTVRTAKTIVVPLDGSRESEASLPYAAELARALKAALHLVSVIDTQFAYLFAGSDQPVVDSTERQRSQAADYLSAKMQALREDGVEVTSAVLLGDPAQEILREAESIPAGMVATATHGRGGLQRWALGSVADKVMRLGHRPTLLVRPAAETDSHRGVAFRRVMVPLDGSAAAEAALTPALELADGCGATLLLARSEEWLSVALTRWGGEGAYIPDLGKLEEETTQMVQGYLAEVRSRLPSSVCCETAALRGLTIPELEALYEQRNAGLVVMTTHGRGGFSRLVLGSTADRLIRDGIPALLIPPGAQ